MTSMNKHSVPWIYLFILFYLFIYVFIYLQTCQTLQEYERMTALNDVYEQALCSVNSFVYFIYLFIYRQTKMLDTAGIQKKKPALNDVCILVSLAVWTKHNTQAVPSVNCRTSQAVCPVPQHVSTIRLLVQCSHNVMLLGTADNICRHCASTNYATLYTPRR